jgi:hypothetical protein
MSGYLRSFNKNQKPRYKLKNTPKPSGQDEPVKSEAVQTTFIKTQEEGIQIDMGEGIPCRLIPLNPEDYPKLLALLKIHQN